MTMKMHESRLKSTNVPRVSSDNLGAFVQVPERGPDGSPGQPMFVFVRNNGANTVFVALDVGALRSPETLSEAFQLLKNDFMFITLAPGQKLYAAVDLAGDGAQGVLSYSMFAMPFWMAGPVG
jgi:hypothetical protein